MNIAELSIRKSVITITLTVVIILAGLKAYQAMPRLEDPEFTIKEAVIRTPYPGASAAEVEKEVSDVIERACQELGQLKRVESTSMRGVSIVKAVIKDQYGKAELPQVWDELRRKVNDWQAKLPPGAGPSVVNDDYGDVYGIYLAISGEGYAYKELYEYAKLLRRELLLVKDVKKIAIWGDQPEVVWVEMSRSKMAALGIAPEDIYRALTDKNIAVDSGDVHLGTEYIPLNPTGEFKSEKEFADLVVSARGGGRLIYLKDVADVRRGYMDPPKNVLRYNGKPAVGLAISTAMGGNVVEMGKGVNKRLAELQSSTPVGIDLEVISHQSDSVVISVNNFVVNLIEAIVIVVVTLLLTMGLRSGLIIGFILFLTICGSFIFMKAQGIILERISLGALIIALGMLVDNAIVIVDGMKVRIEQGMDRIKAAAEITGQTATPLLAATVIAVLAFAAIGTSDDSTGEYCRSLFQVILISLMFSWVTAVTATPLIAKLFLGSPKKGKGGASSHPYGGGFFKIYRNLLTLAITRRWVTLVIVAGIFMTSLFAFRFVSNSFFPDSTRPQFFIEVYQPEGIHINDAVAELKKAEDYLKGLEGVTAVITEAGGGDPRFLLTYVPGKATSAYGVILVSVKDYKTVGKLLSKVQTDLDALLTDSVVNVRRFLLGPGEGGKIQLRISGPDRTVLRQMARKAIDILEADPNTKSIHTEWQNKVKVIRPQLSEAQARQLGVARPMVAEALQAAFSGRTVGLYREKDELLPIIARAPEGERLTIDNMQDLQIWSSAVQKMVPLRQVVSDFKTETEDPVIWRRDRITTIKIHADPREGLASPIFRRVKSKIEKALGAVAPADNPDLKVKDSDKIPLSTPDYTMAWGGEAEDSVRAQAGLAKSLPVFLCVMVLIVVFLFNSIRQTLVIWLTVPLALIGVTAGLLLFKQPFGFMALLGLLSLSGMLIKNAIVLIDQINQEVASGKPAFQAVVDSGVSRMLPVANAALTTILGMIPLLQDAFFVAMAVTIMMGLLFATILTLIVVPVLYTVFYKVQNVRT